MSAQSIQKIAKDGYLFKEGEEPKAMFIVKSGLLAVTKPKGTSEIVLAEIKPGAMVGEMALFDRKPRSAHVKALKDSEVICLPFESLEKQLEQMPVWLRAILNNLNDNLREANKKIKQLEVVSDDKERFPVMVINKLLSIFNFVSLKYGQKEGDAVVVPPNRLRNTTIQVFQEPTNKMDTLLAVLEGFGMTKTEDIGEGKKKISNLKPDFLFEYVDWSNEHTFKQERQRIDVVPEEIPALAGLLKYAERFPAEPKGGRKVSLTDLQNDSVKEFGYLIKPDDFNTLIEKKFLPEKQMGDGKIILHLQTDGLDKITNFWKFHWDIKKVLK